MSLAHARWETHWDAGHNWALVLAAGEGTRLQALTTTASGVSVPKQFCSLGGDSLLHQTLERAWTVAPRVQTCAVVAEQHRHWWEALELDIPVQNIVAQPRNRGTANGILLPLLRILRRDPEATLLILPSDHYVRNESTLATSMQHAMAAVNRDPGHLVLLGVTPEEPDPELGYIVADGTDVGGIRAVREFVEKPSASTARELMACGGVWNSFIFAAHGRTLLRAFEQRCGDVVREMQAARDSELAELYGRLPVLDFSREVLQRTPSALKVLTVPACGWSDLGTPRRVAQVVRQRRATHEKPFPMMNRGAALLDLTTRHMQLGAFG